MLQKFGAFLFGLLLVLPGLLLATEGGEHATAPHSIPTSVWFHFVNFAILVFLLYRWIRVPLRDYLIKRQDTIREALENAESARKEAELRRQTYSRRLASLDEEIRTLREQAEGAARDEAAQIIANARAMVQRVESETQRLLQEELTKARYQLRREAIDLAVELARGMLSTNVSEADQRRLAEEYLERVGQAREIH